jgi:hypothetical protein
MSDQIITTKRGTFGRLQVTLPMSVKSSMASWIRKSGMGKSEFLRVALMIGASKLAEQINAKKPDEGYQVEEFLNSQTVTRT